jgi:uncharacterized peroxidase-related enzyme
MKRLKTLKSEEVNRLLDAGPEKVRAHKEWGTRVRQNLPVKPDESPQNRTGGLAYTLGMDPELLYLWFSEEYHVLKEGKLGRSLKELIAVVVDDKNQCPGCVRFHSTSAKVEGIPHSMLEIAQDFDNRKNELPEKIRETIEFAVKVSTNHTRVTDEDFERLRKLDYSDEEILEIISVAFIAERFAKFVLITG